MLCPNCGHTESKVIDSRSAKDGSTIKRRRECLSCGTRFTTFERREDLPVMVQKRSGRIEPFDRSKLLRSLVTATVKRNIPLATLQELVDTIENDIRYKYRDPVPSQELGNEVLIRLAKLDKVAYIRFASVYKDFQNLDEFNAELQNLSASDSSTEDIES